MGFAKTYGMASTSDDRTLLSRMGMQPTDENSRWFVEKLGDFLLDMAKLVFGGVILVGIMESEVNLYWLFGLGSFATVWMTFTGFLFLKLSHPKK